MALDENQIAYRDKHMNELKEYWDRVSESEGFDLEGIPPVANGMARCDCRNDPNHPYMALVNLYARLGIHRYNMSQGTCFRLVRVKKFNYTLNCLKVYYITAAAIKPSFSPAWDFFQVGVSEQSFGKLHLKCFIARPKGTPNTTNQPYQPHGIASEYELPHWPSDFNDTTRFYEVKESELDRDSCIHLYLELAIYRNDPFIPSSFLSGLKIVKVSIETSEDVEPNELILKAKSATFYITFKGLANARVGELGEDVERKVIVRRVVDEVSGDLTLFGGFGFYIGEVAEERPMFSPSLENIPNVKDPLGPPPSKLKRQRRRPLMDMGWFNNQCTFEYEKKHNLPYPKRKCHEAEKTPSPRAKRARTETAMPHEAEPKYFKDKRNLEDLWKAAFPVCIQWDQQDILYESKWDFKNVEEALEEGGMLYGKRVYVFGCTESQSVPHNNGYKTVLVPTVVCIDSSIPPFDKIGVGSVQGGDEEIIPMKSMKMAWVPYIPLEKRDRAVERTNFPIFVLGCTQRRSALKHLKDDRAKKFNYYLPYINNPFKKDESEQSSVVQITFPSEPPIECEYDWAKDTLEEFTDDLIKKKSLLMDQKDEFKDLVIDKVSESVAASEEALDKATEGMSEETKKAYKEMKLYKFYPLPSPDTPDVAGITKSSAVNKYFGNAHQVF